MFRIHVTREFDAAHFLNRTNTKCDQLHGHRWSVVCTFAATKLTKQGWVINFTTVKKWLDQLLEQLDHNILNFYVDQPTAENLCLYIYQGLHVHTLGYQNNSGTDVFLEKVCISETPGNTAEFSCIDVDTRSLGSRRFWKSEKGSDLRLHLADVAKEQWKDPIQREKKVAGIRSGISEEECQARSIRMLGEKNPMKDRANVEKMMIALRKSQKLSPNRFEQKLIEDFRKHQIALQFVGDGTLIIDGKIPDFVNLEKHLIVEANGRFWHSGDNPWYHTQDDSEDRRKFFNQRGWQVYFIWDDEYQKNPSRVLQEVASFVKGYD